MEQQTIKKGTWWLPSKPNKVLHGTLTSENGQKNELVLSGLFKNISEKDLAKIPIIYGKTYEEEPITILDAHEKKYIPGHYEHESIISARTVLIGKNVPKNQLSKYTNFSLRVRNLEQWAMLGQIKQNRRWKGTISKGFRASYSNIPRKNVYKSKNLEIFFHHGYSVHTEKLSLEITQGESIQFYFKKPQTFEDGFLLIRHFLNLIGCGMDTGIEILSIQCQVKGDQPNEWLKMHTDRFFNPTIKEVADPRDMLFRFNDVTRNYRAIFEKWMALRKEIEPIIGLRNALRIKDFYFETQILILAQALESIHRRFVKTSYATKEYWAEQIYPRINIPTGIDAGHRSAIQVKLKYAYEYSLRKRLNELLKKMPSKVVNDYITKDVNSFVGTVADLRNYYTHYDDDSILAVAHSDAAFFLPIRLKLILDYYILIQTGFSEKAAENLIAGRYADWQIPGWAPWEFHRTS